MKKRALFNILIGLMCGIFISILLFFTSLSSILSSLQELMMLLFIGGFIAGLSLGGGIEEGVVRGAICGAVISASMILDGIILFSNGIMATNIPVCAVLFTVVLIPANSVSSIVGISIRSIIQKLMSREPGWDHLLKRNLIPIAGICTGAAISFIPVLLIPYLGRVFLYYIGTIILITPIIGGCVAGILSGRSILGGLRAGLLSALLVYFILFVPAVLSFGVNEGSGLAIFGFIGLSTISIILYPIGGVIGSFLKSAVKIKDNQ
jgi:hypothetical protein